MQQFPLPSHILLEAKSQFQGYVALRNKTPLPAPQEVSAFNFYKTKHVGTVRTTEYNKKGDSSATNKIFVGLKEKDHINQSK